MLASTSDGSGSEENDTNRSSGSTATPRSSRSARHRRGPADGHRSPPRSAPGLTRWPVCRPLTSPLRSLPRETPVTPESPTCVLVSTRHTRPRRRHPRRPPPLAQQGKLYVRDRIAPCSTREFRRGRRYANSTTPSLPADGVVTGRGAIDDRPVVVIANDPTVKAGSWGSRTVEKIVRATEIALREELPVFWLVDSAGARITDQVDSPGRRAPAGSSHNQVALSGKVPQICCLFGPSVAGGALHPELLRPHHHGRGQCVDVSGQPRMAEMVVGRRFRSRTWVVRGCTAPSPVSVTCSRRTTRRPSSLARLYFSYVPVNWQSPAADLPPGAAG